MPDAKFSALPLVTAGANDVVPVIQGVTPSRTTPTSIAALATKTTVGLPNVDNTSDASKPISTATQTALDGKQATGNYATGGGTATGTNTGDQNLAPYALDANVVHNSGNETVAGIKTFSADIFGSLEIFAGTFIAQTIVPIASAVIPTNYVATRSSKYEITGALSLELQGTSILAIL